MYSLVTLKADVLAALLMAYICTDLFKGKDFSCSQLWRYDRFFPCPQLTLSIINICCIVYTEWGPCHEIFRMYTGCLSSLLAKAYFLLVYLLFGGTDWEVGHRFGESCMLFCWKKHKSSEGPSVPGHKDDIVFCFIFFCFFFSAPGFLLWKHLQSTWVISSQHFLMGFLPSIHFSSTV